MFAYNMCITVYLCMLYVGKVKRRGSGLFVDGGVVTRGTWHRLRGLSSRMQ